MPLSPSTFMTPVRRLRSGQALKARASVGQLVQTSLHRTLIVITLLAHRNRDGQTILRRWQGARRIRRVCAGRILCAVEVEHQLARLGQSVIGQRRVEKAPGAVGLRLTRSVAKDEKQFGDLRALENGFETERFAVERELRRARDVGFYLSAQYRRNRNLTGRIVGDPFGFYTVSFIGRVPAEAVKL